MVSTVLVMSKKNTHNRWYAEKLLTRRAQVNLRHRILPTARIDLDTTAQRARDYLVPEADADDGLSRVLEKICEVVDKGNDPWRVVERGVLWFWSAFLVSSLRVSVAESRTAPGNHQPVEIFEYRIDMRVGDIPLGHLELRLRIGARQPAHALGEEGAEHVPVGAPEFDYARERNIALEHGETKLGHCNTLGWVGVAVEGYV